MEQLLLFLGSGWAWLGLAVLLAWSLFAARRKNEKQASTWTTRRQERRDAFAAARTQLAAQPGLQLGPAPDPDLPAFDLLDQRRNGYGRPCTSFEDLCAGRVDDASVSLFDFERRCDDDPCEGDLLSHRRTVVCLASAQARLPSFRIEPRLLGALSLAVSRLRDRNLTSEPHAAFDKQYSVAQYNPEGADAPDIRRVLTPAVLDLLAEQPDLSLECMGGTLILYCSASQVARPEDLCGLVHLGLSVYRLLRSPDHPR
jgi:hypothetical protein